MAYVPVPKDLSKIKTKVAFNLTKRQIICFAAALAMGLPLFFLLKDSAGTSMAAFAMIVVMLPCFLLAMYEKHGQPLEVVIKNVIQTKFIRPKERPYQTENFYAVIEKQGGLIRIEWRAFTSIVQISVKDNGSGIHPDDLYHIFKRFYRSRFSKDTQGIGLGLSLTKAIVEAHNGTIEVDSTVGMGTSFTINFLNPTKL